MSYIERCVAGLTSDKLRTVQPKQVLSPFFAVYFMRWIFFIALLPNGNGALNSRKLFLLLLLSFSIPFINVELIYWIFIYYLLPYSYLFCKNQFYSNYYYSVSVYLNGKDSHFYTMLVFFVF